MRFWVSCQYAPVGATVESLDTQVYSHDWPTIGGGLRAHNVSFDCSDVPSPCTFNQQGLFQATIDVGISGTPTEPWEELLAPSSGSSACQVQISGQPSPNICGSGIWSQSQPGYPAFPLHFWDGSIDGNKVPIGQTYGMGSDEDGENPTALWGDPVNSLTGSFYTSMVDAQLPGVGRPFRIKRTYNSGGAVDGTTYSTVNGPMGHGWKFTYGAYLEFFAGGDLVYHAASGKQLAYYKQSGSSSFRAHPGVTSVLVKNANGTHTLTRRNGTELKFKSTGELLSIKDRMGNLSSLAYNSGRLSSITDTAGRVIDVTTNATTGKITKITLPDGRFVSYSYGSNDLLSVTDLLGNTWSYTYDAHKLATITDPRPKTTITNVYTSGRVTQQTDGEGNVSSYAWDEATDTATFTDERGKQWKHVYDKNKLIRVIPPAPFSADTTEYTYDGSLKPATIREPDGDTWAFAYVHGEAGNLTQMTATDPLQRATVTTYTALHQPDTVTDPRGKVTDYNYDANGNLTQIIQPGNVTTSFAYNATTGKLTSTTDPNAKTTSFTYGANGNLTRITDPLGKATNLNYDSSGRLIEKKDPRLKIWTYAYNAANQITSVDPPLVPATTYTYTKVGQLKTVTDARTNTLTYAYDGNGHLLTIKAPDNSIVTTYTYLPTGQVDTAKDANNHVTDYDYDETGRLTRATDPLNRHWDYDYRPDGALKTKTLPSLDTITYQYWEDGQPKNINYSNANTPDVSFTYDTGGRTATMTDGAGTVSYGYDDLNRLTAVTRGADQFSYSYLAGGQLDIVTYPGGATTDYDYRDDSRVGTVTADGASTAYGYDDAGNLTSATLPNGITTTYSWDDASRLTNVEHKKGANVLQNHAITLIDNNGNPTRIVGPSGTTNYTYDMFDRLEKVCTPSCTGGSPSGIGYTYDKAGNRLTEVRYGAGGGTTTYNYDNADQLTSTTGLVAKTYGYDSNGNQATAGARTFTYDSEARMLSTTQGGTTTTYAYDGAGDMLTRAVGGTTQASFLWDPNGAMSQLAIERDGGGAQVRRFAYGAGGPGGLLSMNTGGASHYYLPDALGSVGALSSQTGVLEWAYAYEGYGTSSATQLDPGAPVNPMGFHGQYQEPSSLYNMRARQYDGATGRFLGRDPLSATTGGGRMVSTYAYGFNRPTVLSDPTGLAPDTQAWYSRWFDAANQWNPALYYLESCFGSDGTQSVVSWAFSCGVSSTFLATSAVGLGSLTSIGSTTRAGYAASSIDEAVSGLSAGRSAGVRVVNSAEELDDLFAQLSRGGKVVENSYPGKFVRLPDGTSVGLRGASRSGGSTIDIVRPGQTPIKIHIGP